MKVAAQNIWQKKCTLWWANRQIGTDPGDRIAYIGSYTSTDLRMTLHVTMLEGQVVSDKAELDLCIDNPPGQNMSLCHYHHDTWTFFPGTLDECLVRGLGIHKSSWRAFNLDFTRFGKKKFQGHAMEHGSRCPSWLTGLQSSGATNIQKCSGKDEKASSTQGIVIWSKSPFSFCMGTSITRVNKFFIVFPTPLFWDSPYHEHYRERYFR